MLAGRSTSKHERGYSLLEILVVLAIIALITSATALALFKFIPEARIKTTLESARVLRIAVAMYRMDHVADECPTVDLLVKDHVLDEATKTTDAWDLAFVIECDDHGGVSVASAGPDTRHGSADDIRVPAPPPKAAIR